MEPNEKQPEEHPRDRLRRAAEALFGALWKRKTARFLGVGWREFRGWGKQDRRPPLWAVECLEYERFRRREAAKGAEMNDQAYRTWRLQQACPRCAGGVEDCPECHGMSRPLESDPEIEAMLPSGTVEGEVDAIMAELEGLEAEDAHLR